MVRLLSAHGLFSRVASGTGILSIRDYVLPTLLVSPIIIQWPI